MSGWMKYPSNRCLDCDRYDYEEDNDWAICNNPADTCKAQHDDCPLWDEEEEGEK